MPRRITDSHPDDAMAHLPARLGQHPSSPEAEGSAALVVEGSPERRVVCKGREGVLEGGPIPAGGDGGGRRVAATVPAQLPLPPSYKRDLDRALEILRGFGCTEIYLFGSLASGEFRERSDIDLAVRGCPKGEFFKLYGRLMMELEHPVDLVSMEYQGRFAKYLEEHGRLLQIG